MTATTRGGRSLIALAADPNLGTGTPRRRTFRTVATGVSLVFPWYNSEGDSPHPDGPLGGAAPVDRHADAGPRRDSRENASSDREERRSRAVRARDHRGRRRQPRSDGRVSLGRAVAFSAARPPLGGAGARRLPQPRDRRRHGLPNSSSRR